MKFLTKNPESPIIKNGTVYKTGHTLANRELKRLLLNEQKGFCAYTEEYLAGNTLSEEIEHFNPARKGNDDYFNYYVVSRFSNQRKMKIDRDGKFRECLFFNSLFFQKKGGFDSRIEYREGIYKERNIDDTEAKEFIEYIGFNDPIISKKRSNTIRRLKNTIGSFTINEKLEYFRNEDKDMLSFITVIEHELQIDLTEILNS